MRSLVTLALLLLVPACFAQVPALQRKRPLPKGCLLHALLYAAALDPAVGTAEIVKVVGGGGIPHAIVVISTPDGRRYGRDEDLGVFALEDRNPQEAFDRARRDAIADRSLGDSGEAVGPSEERRSLRDALERLAAAGFHPQRIANVIVWKIGSLAYVYSPLSGCAEIRTHSPNLSRIAAAALAHWAGRR